MLLVASHEPGPFVGKFDFRNRHKAKFGGPRQSVRSTFSRFGASGKPGAVQDEKAIKEWRSNMEHRAAQDRGRQEILTDYRIRVMSLVRDYGMFDRDQAPQKLPDAVHGENA